MRVNAATSVFSILSIALLGACRGADSQSVDTLRVDALPAPPLVAQKSHEVAAPHGATRQDEYYWLRDDTRKSSEMLAYLKAENAYADAVMTPLKALEERLYGEMIGRIKQDDATVPYRYKDYWYYTRFEEGKEYPIYARRKDSLTAPEEVMLDVNALAANKNFYQVDTWVVSPDQQLLAYVQDSVGRRQHTLRI